MTLPIGWRTVSLGDVAETTLGKMLDRGRLRGHQLVPYLRNANVQWGHIDADDVQLMELGDDQRRRFGLEAGDLLICEGGEIGRCAIWPGSPTYIAFQKALHRVRVGTDLDVVYLRYLMEHYSHVGTLMRYATGSTIPHLPQQQLRRLRVPLPRLPQQRRIVEILEDHLSRLDEAEKLLRSVSTRWSPLVSSILQQAVPMDGTIGWQMVTVAEAGRLDLGRQRHPDWHNGPEMRPYLRVANVFEDRIDTSDVMEMDFSGGAFTRFRLEPGDVLLNEGQSPHLLGRPAIYRGNPPEVAFTNSILRFRARPDVLPEWALLVFRRHMRSGRFMRESRITTNIAHLSAGRLKSVEFPIPKIEEQRRILSEVEAQLTLVAASERAAVLAMNRSKGLRRALLSAAFSGRLTSETAADEIKELAGV